MFTIQLFSKTAQDWVDFDHRSTLRAAREVAETLYARKRWQIVDAAGTVRDDHSRSLKRAAKRAKDQALRDLGLTRVRGAQGGVYWE